MTVSPDDAQEAITSPGELCFELAREKCSRETEPAASVEVHRQATAAETAGVRAMIAEADFATPEVTG